MIDHLLTELIAPTVGRLLFGMVRRCPFFFGIAMLIGGGVGVWLIWVCPEGGLWLKAFGGY
jgi:hypothetical protein